MFPRQHFFFGLMPAILLSYFDVIFGVLFLIGAFLIDFDHYLVYVIAFKDLSLRRAVKFFSRDVMFFRDDDRKPMIFLPFHNIETMLLVLVLATYMPILYFLFLGMLLHYLLDLSYDNFIFGRFVREFSIIGYIFKRRRFYLSELRFR